MTEWSARSPTWTVRSPIKPLAMFCGVTVYRLHRSAKRTTTWAEFIRTHLALLVATDFLTVEVVTLRGSVTYYVLFFIHLESRRVDIAGITTHPSEPWMQQIARNVTMDGWGILGDCRYLLHDRDTKYSASDRAWGNMHLACASILVGYRCAAPNIASRDALSGSKGSG